MITESSFPPIPSLKAEWAPVYLEPLHGSGERIVLLVVCVAPDGSGASRLAPRPKILQCMYGAASEMITGLANLIADAFEGHLESGLPLAEWSLPSSNCHLGPIRIGLGHSLEGVLEQAVRLTSSLRGGGDEGTIETIGTVDTSVVQIQRFVQQVKETTIAAAKDYEDRFNQTVSVRHGAEPTSIGYLGVQLAANFGVLVPGNHSLSRNRTRAKSKLLDLQALRDQVDGLVGRQSYELLLWVPPKDSPMFSDADLRRVDSVYLELQEIGDKHSLRVARMASAQAAADRILTAEGHLLR